VKYTFRTVKSFRRSLAKLPSNQKECAKKAFAIFKNDPFDPRLRPHKIHKLSAAYGKTIYSVCLEGDLRAVFYIEKDVVWSVDIGSHAIYRS
jgi:mRNA-degrading endonuclease YafQ of YafQ-DinJ toxin-antitoxin module